MKEEKLQRPKCLNSQSINVLSYKMSANNFDNILKLIATCSLLNNCLHADFTPGTRQAIPEWPCSSICTPPASL